MAGVKTKHADATRKQNAPRADRAKPKLPCSVCGEMIDKQAERTTILTISYVGASASKQRQAAHRKCVGADKGKK